MSQYQIIDINEAVTTKKQWIDTLCHHLKYDLNYQNNLTMDNLYPLDQSEAMMQVVDYLKKANQYQKKILIFGDYDCDGICATTIMDLLLTFLNIDHGYYIPNRFNEGYGLNTNRIQQAFDKGYTTILTVDNGVVAYDAIQYALDLKMDVIITDHHTINDPLDCLFLHPDLMNINFKGLCGAGVAYELSRHFLRDAYLDTLAMIATIGDLMVLENENRQIVKQGLHQLNQHKFLPIISLMDKKDFLDEKAIAFQLVPKINAIGRMETSNPNQLVAYLKLDNAMQIQQMALQILMINQQRKDLVAQCASQVDIIYNQSMILATGMINEGIIGLVAAQLSTTYHKPTLVLTLKDGIYKGSGRSVEGCDLYQFIQSLNFGNFIAFGGHSQALGLSLYQEKLNEFIDLIDAKKDQLIVEEQIKIIFRIKETQISSQLNDALKLLKPFDATYQQPFFVLNQPVIVKTQLLKDIYPKLTLESGLNVLSFKYQDIQQLLTSSWIVSLNENNFRNNITIQAMIESLLK